MIPNAHATIVKTGQHPWLCRMQIHTLNSIGSSSKFSLDIKSQRLRRNMKNKQTKCYIAMSNETCLQSWVKTDRESGWTPGVGDGQGGLACCDSWGHRESDTTERLNWIELNMHTKQFSFYFANCSHGLKSKAPTYSLIHTKNTTI